jgi:hypothetical protein
MRRLPLCRCVIMSGPSVCVTAAARAVEMIVVVSAMHGVPQ